MATVSALTSKRPSSLKSTDAKKKKKTAAPSTSEAAIARLVERLKTPLIGPALPRSEPAFSFDARFPDKLIRDLRGERYVGRFVDGKFEVDRVKTRELRELLAYSAKKKHGSR
jgi:hypothetical protein